MAYTTVSAIQDEFKNITFSASTYPTSTAVSEFITQEEYLLDAEVGTVYTTPITGTMALSVMKLMSTLMVKARVMEILTVKTGSSDEDQGNPADDLRQRVRDMLDKIKSKLLILSDETLLETSGGVRDYNSNNDITQTFKATTDQW